MGICEFTETIYYSLVSFFFFFCSSASFFNTLFSLAIVLVHAARGNLLLLTMDFGVNFEPLCVSDIFTHHPFLLMQITYLYLIFSHFENGHLQKY